MINETDQWLIKGIGKKLIKDPKGSEFRLTKDWLESVGRYHV
jgi:hypothetical protein